MSGAVAEAPVRRPLLLQRWSTMTFLHWSYDPEAVRPLVPAGLGLDLFDGAAWVSIAAFDMTAVRLPGLPPAPRLSRFPETNLRTYVRAPDGRDGVWFLSLEAASLPLVLGGRAVPGLPYHWAAMSIECGATVRYRSRRRHGTAGHDIAVAPGRAYAGSEPTPLDHYLTGRWRAYGRQAGRFTVTNVEHLPWPLRRAALLRLRETLTAAAGLPAPRHSPLVHYCSGVDVRLAAPRLLG